MYKSMFKLLTYLLTRHKTTRIIVNHKCHLP